MSVGFRSLRSRGAAGLLAAAGTLALGAPAADALDPLLGIPSGHGSLITVGEGSSPVPGLPAIKIEVPSPGGGAPLAEVKVDEKGVTATTPVTPAVEVPTPKAELPSAPTVPTVPVQPPPGLETITGPTGGGSGGSGSGGSGSAGSGSGGSGGSGATVVAAASSTTAAAADPNRAAHRSAAKGSAGGKGGGRGSNGGGSPAGLGGSPAGGAGLLAAGTARNAANHLRATHATRGGGDPLSSIGRALPLPLPVPDWSKPIILALALLAIGLGVRWRVATRRAGRLERRQGSLLRDIEVMQAALVPEVPERLGGLSVSVAYRPAEGPAAGGDFYDVFAMDSGRVAVILGDVAGHGHDALRQAALTRYTLRAFLKETGDPRAALALSGHALSEPGVEHFSTVAIAIFDGPGGTLTYALAGHPPPIVLGVAAGEAPSICSSPPVGCELPTGRRQRTVSLPAGARACFFSDGLLEARRSITPAGGHPDLLGRERLRELLTDLPADANAEQLLSAIRAETAATPDDMAACILTSRASTSRRNVDIEELEVDRHVIDGGYLEAYLHASGLIGAEAARVLAAASARLEAHETAILTVDRGGGEIEIGVRAGVGERLPGTIAQRPTEPGSTRLQRA